ncbi:unnamed protein product [Phyllotreta striolata]|uniref:UDP-glucuronosyltransferase n=1 Tax=Phyllotreta striolata TaxID=444603 RepID=A0A9N9XQK4_PHYSR|nr:unnamed protein product [Phyllotreta striolata]
MFKFCYFYFIGIANFWCFVQCYNYLAVFPIPMISHMSVFSPLINKLVERGHNVTLVSGIPEKSDLPNYKIIDISNDIAKLMEVLNITVEGKEDMFTPYQGIILTSIMADKICEGLSSPKYQELLRETHTFDAIITEIFNTDCFLSIAHTFDAPIIGFSSSAIVSWMEGRYGIPSIPSFIPNIMVASTDRMDFLQRLQNTLVFVYNHMFFTHYRQRKDREIIRKYIGNSATDLDTFIKKTNLVFINTHFTMKLSRPFVPNAIEVGGIHLKKPKVLPKILKKWVDESPHGVIYFSMGSFNKGSTFPKEKMKAFIEAFELLPQRVIWKWESETMEGKTDKILPYKWIPQLDLLCDPNVKLFISHAGLLGITEAVHCGVPLVLIPQFGDQHNNAKCMESTGAAVILPISKITKETAYEALSKALNLSDNMKELSNRFNDRPMSPLDTAVYWSEYVVRHKGAYFMKSAAIDLPFYQYYLLDVLLFIVSILLLVTYVSYRFLKCVLGLTGNQNSKRKKD